MRGLTTLLSRRLTGLTFDARIAQAACYLGAMAIVPVAMVAMVRNSASRGEFVLGAGLAGLTAVLIVMLGILSRAGIITSETLALRQRWVEFASYPACLAVLVGGITALPGLGLSPAGLTLGLLVMCALSLSVLVLGMLTSVLARIEIKE